jgi:hypothetical protein
MMREMRESSAPATNRPTRGKARQAQGRPAAITVTIEKRVERRPKDRKSSRGRGR